MSEKGALVRLFRPKHYAKSATQTEKSESSENKMRDLATHRCQKGGMFRVAIRAHLHWSAR